MSQETSRNGISLRLQFNECAAVAPTVVELVFNTRGKSFKSGSRNRSYQVACPSLLLFDDNVDRGGMGEVSLWARSLIFCLSLVVSPYEASPGYLGYPLRPIALTCAIPWALLSSASVLSYLDISKLDLLCG